MVEKLIAILSIVLHFLLDISFVNEEINMGLKSIPSARIVLNKVEVTGFWPDHKVL